jgi:hypothetical protein
MKNDNFKFWIKTVFLLVPFIFLFGYAEFKARKLPNSYKVKHDLMEKELSRSRILVLGTSEAIDGINPQYFCTRGFNLANHAQSIFYDVRLFESYLDRFPDLRLVVFSVSYFSLWYILEDSPLKWKEYFYFHYFTLKNPKLDLFDLRTLLIAPVYPKDFLNKMVLGNIDNVEYFGDIRSNGWNCHQTEEKPLTDAEGKKTANSLNDMIKPENLRNNLALLEEFLKIAGTKKTEVVFVFPPVHRSLRDQLDTTIILKNSDQMKVLSKKFNCRFFDYFSDPRFSDADFADADHLNSKGAQKFSEILNTDFIEDICTGVYYLQENQSNQRNKPLVNQKAKSER